LIDRHRDGAVVPRPRFAGVDQLGFDSHGETMRRRHGESTGDRLIAGRPRQLFAAPGRRRAGPAARPADRRLADSIRSVEFTPRSRELRDSTRLAAGTAAAVRRSSNNKEHDMNTLDLDTLEHVTGGATVRASSSNDAITQSLTSLQTTISSLANNNNNSSQNNLLLPMAMMMAMNRRQPTIVSGGATVVG
jgi:hypothetical protein